MKEKSKNPLYVVKGDQVETATNFLDMLVKKLNLEPFVEFMLSIFKMLMDYAQTYTTFLIIKNLLDEFMKRVELFRKYSII